MIWRVDVTLRNDSGATPIVTTWTLVEDTGEVADTPTLIGLDVGWAMPKSGLWPLQPEAMVATATISVPNFPDLSVFGEGDLLTIAFRDSPDDADPILARFSGDLTDLKAIPRAGRDGVFLSLAAVDYTVRPIEQDTGAPIAFSMPFGGSWRDYLGGVWAYSLQPGAPTGVDLVDLWTSDVAPLHLPLEFPGGTGRFNLRPIIDAGLLQSVTVGGPGGIGGAPDIPRSRQILAPAEVDADGDLAAAPSGRFWTIDTIIADPFLDDDPVVIPAGAVDRRDFTWAQSKATQLGHVNATGNGGDSDAVQTYDVPGSSSIVYENVPVDIEDDADALNVAKFYGGHRWTGAALTWSRWQLDKLRIPVTRAGFAFPASLFPDWTLPEGDQGRARCYSRQIQIEDVQTPLTPDGVGTVIACLSGARLTLEAGQVVLELACKIPQPT
jgi:hypothetical protein